MKTIHKYKLSNTEQQSIMLPRGAEILSIQWQIHSYYLWAIHDNAETGESRKIRRIGTGWDIPEDVNLKHISTIQEEDNGWGIIVYHFFEETPKETIKYDLPQIDTNVSKEELNLPN